MWAGPLENRQLKIDNQIGPMVRRRHYSFFDESFLSRLERLRLLSKRLSTRSSPGQRRSRRLGDGLEFADHRDYVSGDDIRFIDWPYYARMERLLLRLFHEHSEADVMVLLDVSASMAAGGDMAKFDFGRRVAAALAYVAMASLERVIVQPFAGELGAELRTGRNRDQIFRVLEFLDSLRPGGPTALERCSTLLGRRRERPGTLILISDLMECQDELAAAAMRLRQACGECVVLQVYSPGDAEPALSGSMRMEAAEGPGGLTLTVDAAVLEAYRGRWAEFGSACERTCVRCGLTYASACSDLPFDRLVLQTLRRCGVLTG